MSVSTPFRRIWLNVLLFAVTVLSAIFVGLTWSASYVYADRLSDEALLALGGKAFMNPQVIALSVVYAAVLIVILLGHELGHYLTCRRYRIEATLPFFIPAPTLVGTLGAFIKIKSPITLKKQLFDIGAAGPLVGFLLALPALVVGLSLSKAVPPIPRAEAMVFGEPLLLKIIGAFVFRGIPAGADIILHPVGFAGWVGILVTSLNLFPLGQLDGGHIAYALAGEKSRRLARVFLGLFAVMGVLFWVGWLVWIILILFLGLKHPRVFDGHVPLSRGRKAIAVLIILIFILSFIPAPIKGFDLIGLLKQFGI